MGWEQVVVAFIFIGVCLVAFVLALDAMGIIE